MPYRPFNGPPLYQYYFEVPGSRDPVVEITVTARDDQEALDKAVAEAALLGMPDAELRCVDYELHEPSGGDGDDD